MARSTVSRPWTQETSHEDHRAVSDPGPRRERLKEAIGIDVARLSGRKTMSGFEKNDWKPCTFCGLTVLLPYDFRISEKPEKGGTAGDRSAA